MNKIILSGNLCKDVELKSTTSGILVLQNTVAVRNDFKNANGEYDSEFINIVVWRQTAEFLSKYATKGSKVLVEGRLTTRSYDKQDGTKGYVTEVQAEKVELLDSKKDDKPIAKEETTKKDDPYSTFGKENGTGITDEDLPF